MREPTEEEAKQGIQALRDYFYSRNGRYPSAGEIQRIIDRETGGMIWDNKASCDNGPYTDQKTLDSLGLHSNI